MKDFQKLIGKKASWNYFGQVEGSYLKRGQGEIIRIEATYGSAFSEDKPIISYFIRHGKANEVECVPNSCITKIHAHKSRNK